jgi:outer membrane protein assembly factor BamE (lipoprotein component of BamABCDE complex)
MTKIIFISLSLLVFTACSTPQHQAVKSIDVGMDKADVLEKMGNPTRKTRHHGQDRWTYEFDGNADSTYIYFSGGKVTYIGAAELSAADKQKAEKFTPLVAPPEKFTPVGQ